MDTHVCPLTGNVNDLYIAYIPQIHHQLSRSASSDAMAYVGLLLMNSVKDQIGGKDNLKWGT